MSAKKLARVLPLASALCLMPFLSGCMSGLFHMFIQSNDPRQPPQVVDVNVQSDPYGNTQVNVSAPGASLNAGGGPGGFGFNLGAPGVSINGGGAFPQSLPAQFGKPYPGVQYPGGQYPGGQYPGLRAGLQYPPAGTKPPGFQGVSGGPVLNPKILPQAPGNSTTVASGPAAPTASGQGTDLNIPDPAAALAELTAAGRGQSTVTVQPAGTTSSTGQPSGNAQIQSRPLSPQELGYDDLIATTDLSSSSTPQH